MIIDTVETRAFSMDYLRFGHGGETLVILPGLSVQSVMASAEAVANAYQALTDDYTLYLLDRRKVLPAAYSMDDMARDTAEALRALGLRQVNLFGVSQGGMIAMLMAVEQPELIKKLVLGSTSACIGQAQYQLFDRWIQMAKRGRRTELYLDFGEALYPRAVFEKWREVLIEASKTVTQADLDRFVVLAESVKDFDITGELHKIACPVLVIGSMDDRVLGADASRRIAEHLKQAELYMYDGYGHAAYDTAEDYKERIARFLENN